MDPIETPPPNVILSFDIGIKNLAYCLLQHRPEEPPRILRWAVKDISTLEEPVKGRKAPKSTFDDVCNNLVAFLDDLLVNTVPNDTKLTVLIENQPAFKAPTMKSIQIFIFAYFKIKGHIPRMISASTKNTFMKKCGYELKAKDYKSNKQTSIQCITDHLEKHGMASEQELLRGSAKKDDLCDAMLQAMAFMATVKSAKSAARASGLR